jgi:hypothetical protein
VPDAGINCGGFSLAQDAGLTGALKRQLAFKDGEAFDKGGMAVLPNNTRPDERRQFHGRAALGIVPGKLEDRRTLTSDGVLPDLADLDRREIWRAVRVRVRHARCS